MSGMTSERLEELRRIAEAATQGPWWVDGWEARTKDGDRFIASIAPAFQGAGPDASCWEVDANIQHIAAFDPTTALELLDALAAARAEAERWKRRHDALRAAVIKADALIVDAIHRATAMYNHTQDADYESHYDGLDEALMILRQLLTEAGGVFQ